MKQQRRTRQARVRFWRWRHNTLLRRSDRVQGWVLLAVWTLALLGGLFAGLAAGTWAAHDLAARRASVHSVSAVLLQDAPKTAVVSPYGSDGTVWAKVRWTDGAGTAHTDLAKVEPGGTTGGHVTVWLDREGTPVVEPAGPTVAGAQAVLLAVPTGLAACALVLLGGRLVCNRLDRRCYEAWAAEWRQVGPQWRKRMLG
ncbi:Rv1733c family protein [Streptomyces sp. NPDC001286]